MTTATTYISQNVKGARLSLRGLVIFVVLLLAAMSYIPFTINLYIIYAITAVLLLLGFRRPAYLVAAIILVEITIAGFPRNTFGVPITAKTLVILISMAVVIIRGPLTLRELNFGPSSTGIIFLGGVFVFLSTVATSGGFRPELTMEVVRQYGLPFIAMLIIPVVAGKGDDLKIVGIISITVIAVSSGAAILQHFRYLGLPSPGLFGSGIVSGRAHGLNSSPIELANHLLIGFMFVWGFFTSYTLNRPEGRLFSILLVMTALGWIFTYTRSLLLAAAAGVVMTIPFLEKRVRLEIVLVSIVILPVLAFVFFKENNRFSKPIADDGSAVSRLVLWQVGYNIATDFPLFGVGYLSYGKVAPRYLEDVVLSDDQRAISRDFELGDEFLVTRYPVHNDFLRVWLSFGTPALLVFLGLLTLTAVKSLRAYLKAKEPWLRGASLGCFAAVIGYAVNSLVHNSLDSTISLWLLGGIAMALAKVVSAEQGAEPETPRAA